MHTHTGRSPHPHAGHHTHALLSSITSTHPPVNSTVSTRPFSMSLRMASTSSARLSTCPSRAQRTQRTQRNNRQARSRARVVPGTQRTQTQQVEPDRLREVGTQAAAAAAAADDDEASKQQQQQQKKKIDAGVTPGVMHPQRLPHTHLELVGGRALLNQPQLQSLQHR